MRNASPLPYIKRHRLLKELHLHHLAARDLETAQSLVLTTAGDYLLRANALKSAGQLVAAYQDVDQAIERGAALVRVYRLRGDLFGEVWKTLRGKELLRERTGPKMRELEQLEHGRRIIERGNSPWQAVSCGTRHQWLRQALSTIRQEDYLRAQRLEESDPNMERTRLIPGTTLSRPFQPKVAAVVQCLSIGVHGRQAAGAELLGRQRQPVDPQQFIAAAQF